MQIKQRITINRPIEQVWDILGNQYGEAHHWAASLYHCQSTGDATIKGAPCAQRTCVTAQGLIEEELKVFDASHYRLAYEIIEGFPFFVDQCINHWQLTATDDDKTTVQMHLVIITKGFFGALMGSVMQRQMNAMTTDVMEDFRHFAEMGLPSPAKVKQLTKAQINLT